MICQEGLADQLEVVVQGVARRQDMQKYVGKSLGQMAKEEDAVWESGKMSGTMYCGDHSHYAHLVAEGARIVFGWMDQPAPTVQPFERTDELQEILADVTGMKGGVALSPMAGAQGLAPSV